MINLSKFKISLPSFILASGSPQRKWILEQLGLDFKIDPPDIDESLEKIKLKRPHAIVKYLALLKAQTIAQKHKDHPILSSDTLVVSSGGEILGKPKNKNEAKRMLQSYNANYCDVYSGLAWIQPKASKTFVGYNKTRLYFKTISTKIINEYLNDEEWMYCSGGVKIEKIEPWIKKREGEYWNVVGLPIKLLEEVSKFFKF